MLDPRLDLLIDLSLDREKSPEVGDTDWTENNEDGPVVSSPMMDSSVLSQMCLEEVGSRGCSFSQFCW